MPEPRWLNEVEDWAWRGFLQMHRLLQTVLEREILADAGLSLSDYHVLVVLSEADGERLRISALAEGLQWSPSRLSHQLTRMQDRDLVRRDGCPTDARGTFAVLTPTGRAAIEVAAPGHLAGVRRHLLDRLSPEQVRALADISEAVIGPLVAGGDGEAKVARPRPPCR